MAIKNARARMFPPLLFLIATIFISFYSGQLSATDPPHRDTTGTDTGWCGKCHTPHSQLGTGYGVLTRVEGNANLCISCHNTGGRATDKPFIDADQAVLGAEPAGTRGWSHRWDSGIGGYVDAYSVSTGTTGRIISGIVGGAAYTFKYTAPRIYEINVATTGNVTGAAGGARFTWRWSQDRGASWSGYSSGVYMTTAGIPLDTISSGNGSIKVSFLNGNPSPPLTSFAGSNDVFRVYVRPEITYPANSVLASRMFKNPNVLADDGDGTGNSYRKAVCSTCHNQHSQSKTTSDPTSDTSYTSGSTSNRHFQRISNMTDSACRDCHNVRNTTNVKVWTGNNLSHPVGVSIGGSTFHAVPYEAVGSTTVQTQYSYKGSVTTGGASVNTFTDSARSFAVPNLLANMTLRFTSGTNKNTTRTISSNTGTTVTWTGGALNVAATDKYEIDADGNLGNSLRFYNNTAAVPSFTAGQVLCLSCHSIHWGDSREDTADIP